MVCEDICERVCHFASVCVCVKWHIKYANGSIHVCEAEENMKEHFRPLLRLVLRAKLLSLRVDLPRESSRPSSQVIWLSHMELPFFCVWAKNG